MAPPMLSLEEVELQVCSEGAMNGPGTWALRCSLEKNSSAGTSLLLPLGEELESQLCSKEAMNGPGT